MNCLAVLALGMVPLWGADAPTQTPREAAIAWCQEDAAAARAAGQDDIAAADEADAKTLAAPALAAPPAVDPDLLPPLSKAALSDRLVTGYLGRIDAMLKAEKTYPKGPEGAEVRGPEGWVFPVRADQLLSLTQAFCHPQSPRAGDARLVVPILRRVASISEYVVPGSKILGDFGCADNQAEAWLILKATHPEILPPGLVKRMDASLATNAEFIANKWGPSFLDPSDHRGVVNMDVRRILALAITDRALGTTTYTDMVTSGVRFIGRQILADGATHYADAQNECYSYHINALRSLIRISQIAHLPEALTMAKSLRWYYPLSVEPGGVAEWATASSWHHYWNTVSGSDGALLMAGLTGCPHNQRIARSGQVNGDLWLASFLRPDLAPAPAPDQYFVYDRNVEGPRGRFGTWSFVGSARDFRYGPQDKARGRSSYVGAVLTTGKTEGWPLDAALQDVGAAVKLKAGEHPVPEQTWHREVATLTADETTTSTVSARCAAIGADAHLSTYGGAPQPWRQRQAWIFTPERMVGLVSVSADADASSFGLLGTIVLVSGRQHWGTQKELLQTGPGAYTYGGLAVTIHAQDFANTTSLLTEAMSGSAIHGSNTPGKSVRLILEDGNVAGDASVAYTKGQSRYFLVEIRPLASSPAKTVTQTREGDLLSIGLTDGTGSYALAYNTGSQTVPWKTTGGPKAVVHTSGETYRPAWISDDGKPATTNAATPWKAGPIPLAAGTLALVETPVKP